MSYLRRSDFKRGLVVMISAGMFITAGCGGGTPGGVNTGDNAKAEVTIPAAGGTDLQGLRRNVKNWPIAHIIMT